MLKQPPGIIVSKIMAMILQAPTISQQPDPWTNVEDGMPIIPGDVNGHGEITVAVMFKTEQRVHTMIYERAIVRNKTVYRWKWPWDLIYRDGGIIRWAYLPQPPQKQEDATDGATEPQC